MERRKKEMKDLIVYNNLSKDSRNVFAEQNWKKLNDDDEMREIFKGEIEIDRFHVKDHLNYATFGGLSFSLTRAVTELWCDLFA